MATWSGATCCANKANCRARGDFHADTPNADRSCETKPISFRTESGPSPLRRRSCDRIVPRGTAPNKPNLLDQEPLPCRHGRARPIAPNEANFMTMGDLSPVPRRSCERTVSRPAVRNKAGMPWAEGPFRAGTAREGGSCKTKPISEAKVETSSAGTPNAYRPCETKPISWREGPFHANTAQRAKQSQFPPDREWAESLATEELRSNRFKRDRANKPNFLDQGPLPCRHGRGRPIAPNEANFMDEGELSPVPRRSCEGIVSRPAVQNKAGMPWAEGSFRADTSRDGPPCETKPISGQEFQV